MDLRPRFLGRLGPADIVTVVNAFVGFTAAVLAPFEPQLAARLILLAAIADGLDGLVARRYGSTPVGEFVDSLADTVSFGVAPAAMVVGLARLQWGNGGELLGIADPLHLTAAVGIPALVVAAAVVRLAMYTAYDVGARTTEGVQTTLAATVLAAATLAGEIQLVLVLLASVVLAYLMVTRIPYPDLRERDALAMGLVQTGAVLAPAVFYRLFPRALLAAALAYLLFAPWLYPRVES
ncbi:phosphatidylcholine/phosphatidylserine synthase [Halorhabdus sp. CBA1104]|uniref:protein sorting system archaetidylserine synthase n=1 Tax=unclassified Halorhabdus TaxID=2621901 RepID=UPI0012B1B840|nr:MULTISPECIES: protein sorting system archaetidylserine synthase [unclassified Halorhabdus]QGN08236.1 phosphatidylcholine/phosphatidylserine synthase [Halorhabdus sp. CBA1104]